MSDETEAPETPEIQIKITPRAQAAIDELQAIIAARYPEATFDVQTGWRSAGIYVEATVDVEDTDEVFDAFGDRLIDFQIEGIPITVSVSQPPERDRARRLEHQERQARRILESLPDRIVQEPAVMHGSPVIKGTLVQVEMVLAHLAREPDFKELLVLYPELTLDDVRACFDFARSQIVEATRRKAPTEPALR